MTPGHGAPEAVVSGHHHGQAAEEEAGRGHTGGWRHTQGECFVTHDDCNDDDDDHVMSAQAPDARCGAQPPLAPG